MATKKKAGTSKAKAGKTRAKLKDLSPKATGKIKGGKPPRGLINFT